MLVGIDLGGTKIALSVGHADGTVIHRTRRPTEPSGRPDADIARIAGDVREAVRAAGGTLADVETIGICAPGPMDPSARRLLRPPNLPGWDDVPLADALEKDLGRPVRLENDANAAALAEWRFGAGQGARNLVYLTMSTGVGGGLILDGRLYRGARGAAGEVGHCRVDWSDDAPTCNCGQRGCLEAYVGGAAWARRLQAIAPKHSRAVELAGSPERVTPRELVAAAHEGDPFACEEMERFNAYLARGLAALAFTLAPELFVLGTICVAAGEALCLAPQREALRANVWGVIAEPIRIETARLGDEREYHAGLCVAMEAR